MIVEVKCKMENGRRFASTDRHCEERSNLNAYASSDNCKIVSSAEKAFSQ